jgi:chromosome segregation ATPase
MSDWKDEIEYLKDELKNKIEALTRQQTANKSYKKRIFETEENLNQSLKIIKAQDNKIQGYENSLNSEKVSAESYKKRFEDAQKSLDEAKKVINEQEIAIEFFKQKKPFKSIKPKIEPKQVKYFKLFGYTIYEKN